MWPVQCNHNRIHAHPTPFYHSHRLFSSCVPHGCCACRHTDVCGARINHTTTHIHTHRHVDHSEAFRFCCMHSLGRRHRSRTQVKQKHHTHREREALARALIHIFSSRYLFGYRHLTLLRSFVSVCVFIREVSCLEPLTATAADQLLLLRQSL